MFDLDEFTAECRAALAEGDRVAALREVLDRVAARPADVVTAVGEPSAGSLQTLLQSDAITILNVVWTPGMLMPPHDHTMLAGIAVYSGHEDNGFWRPAGDGRVEPVGGKRVGAGEVLIMGDDAVHSVQSHPDRYTGGIHVYAGDFFNRDRKLWSVDDGREIAEPPSAEAIFAAAEESWRERRPTPNLGSFSGL